MALLPALALALLVRKTHFLRALCCCRAVGQHVPFLPTMQTLLGRTCAPQCRSRQPLVAAFDAQSCNILRTLLAVFALSSLHTGGMYSKIDAQIPHGKYQVGKSHYC